MTPSPIFSDGPELSMSECLLFVLASIIEVLYICFAFVLALHIFELAFVFALKEANKLSGCFCKPFVEKAAPALSRSLL